MLKNGGIDFLYKAMHVAIAFNIAGLSVVQPAPIDIATVIKSALPSSYISSVSDRLFRLLLLSWSSDSLSCIYAYIIMYLVIWLNVLILN